jgi:hypothetical protein
VTSHGTVNWTAMIGGMVLFIGIFTNIWVAAVGLAMILLGIFFATR